MIFDLEWPKAQIICNDVIKNFQKRNFSCGKIYCRMKDKKPWPVCWHLKQNFAKRRTNNFEVEQNLKITFNKVILKEESHFKLH